MRQFCSFSVFNEYKVEEHTSEKNAICAIRDLGLARFKTLEH